MRSLHRDMQAAYGELQAKISAAHGGGFGGHGGGFDAHEFTGHFGGITSRTSMVGVNPRILVRTAVVPYTVLAESSMATTSVMVLAWRIPDRSPRRYCSEHPNGYMPGDGCYWPYTG